MECLYKNKGKLIVEQDEKVNKINKIIYRKRNKRKQMNLILKRK